MAMTNTERQRKYRKSHRMMPAAEPFKAPDAMPLEPYDSYMRRMIQSFEIWVNENYGPRP